MAVTTSRGGRRCHGLLATSAGPVAKRLVKPQREHEFVGGELVRNDATSLLDRVDLEIAIANIEGESVRHLPEQTASSLPREGARRRSAQNARVVAVRLAKFVSAAAVNGTLACRRGYTRATMRVEQRPESGVSWS